MILEPKKTNHLENEKKINRKIPRNGEKKKKAVPKKRKVKCKANLKRAVERDSCCKACGAVDQLSAHHIIFGDGKKDDSLDNLITLCFSCHRKVHDGYYDNELYVSGNTFILWTLNSISGYFYKKRIVELEKK